MNIFSALADPTRRKILEMLAQNDQLSASDIMEQFSVSPPAISQHLKILREANLVQVEKRAQQRIYRINPSALLELQDWTQRMTQLWNERFDALDRVLEAEKNKPQTHERTGNMLNQTVKEVTLTRIYDATREQVFKAWTDPKLLGQWYCPNVFTCPLCELDPRPGGLFRLHMRSPEGMIFPMLGVFNEVIAPERIVFTANVYFGDETTPPQFESVSTITLRDLGGKTELTVHEVASKATPESAGALAGMEEGLIMSLDQLGELLAKTNH